MFPQDLVENFGWEQWALLLAEKPETTSKELAVWLVDMLCERMKHDIEENS